MAVLNYWWVTRPKRKLNSIPEVLAAFSNVALSVQWSGSKDVHIRFEDELERAGLKRIGQRRDHGGSGGRTYQAWLSSLGLIFIQEKTGTPFLTLAGEAIIEGKNPVDILTKQIINYQFPSPFGIKTHVSGKFHVHPFVFLLRLLDDPRIEYLTENELAKVVMTDGLDDSLKCLENVIEKVLRYRECGDASLAPDFIDTHMPSSGKVNLAHPYSHLTDTANTMINWLEYTQLVYRDNDGEMRIIPEKKQIVKDILATPHPFIDRPENHEYFQRKYGLDPWHQKDTRNLLKTASISSRSIDEQRIKQEFLAKSFHKIINNIDTLLVEEIANKTGTSPQLVEDVLYKSYPHGAVGSFLANYYEMAFKGRDEAVDFELATTEIFEKVFGYKAIHLGQTGSRSAPDVLLVSEEEGYQAIIDNKAYSQYSITGDHHNRMVYNYIEKINRYSSYDLPIGFFTYIAGGFAKNISRQILSEKEESGISGSAISIGIFIKLIEQQQDHPLSHLQLQELFAINRLISFSDFSF